MRTSILESGEVVTFEDPNEGRQIRVESRDEGQVTHAEPAEIAAPATPWRKRLEINGYPHNSNYPHGQLGDKVWVMQDAYKAGTWESYEPQMLVDSRGRVHRRLVFIAFDDTPAVCYWAMVQDSNKVVALVGIGGAAQKTIPVKFDVDGNIEWQKTYVSNAPSTSLALWRLVKDADGNLYGGGYIGDYTKASLVKFSPTGGIIWKRQFDVTSGHFFTPVNVLPGGDVIAVAPRAVARFSSAGTLLWCLKTNIVSSNQTTFRAGNDSVTYCIQTYNTAPNKAVVFAVGSDGTLLWQRAWANIYASGAYSPVYGLFIVLTSYTSPLDTAYIVNLSEDGAVRWVRRLVGPPTNGRRGQLWVNDVTGSLYVGLDVNAIGGFYKSSLLHLPANGSGQGTYTDTEWGDWVYENCDEPPLEVPDPWTLTPDPGPPLSAVPYDIVEVAEPLTIRMLGQHFGEDA